MKYSPSALIGRLSRSAGSTTASHNRFGAYLRNRVIPTNPQTARQLDVRGTLTNNAIAWRQLTEQLRDAWTSLGSQIVRTDSLGDTYSLTGIQAYIMINNNLATRGDSPQSQPPILAEPDALTSMTLTADETGPVLSLAYTVTPLPAGAKLAIFASPAVSPGINFMAASRFKLIQVTAAAAASPANIAATYQAVFGSVIQENTKIFVRAIVINSNGLATLVQQASTIVVAS